MPNSGNSILRAVAGILADRLPPGWASRLLAPSARRDAGFDAMLEIRAPQGTKGRLAVEAKRVVEPRQVAMLESTVPAAGAPRMLVAPFLTKRVRELLAAAGISYADETGNVRIVLERPAVFIETSGAERSPFREARPARTLKGPKAGRVVRALCDFRPPFGVRELASRAGTDPGYVSRVLAFLASEAFVKRETKAGSKRAGRVVDVGWKDLLRRWAEDHTLLESNVTSSYLEPRGLSALLEKLRSEKRKYAVTGSFAASQLAPVAPPRLLTCYVEDPSAAARQLELRPADAGANVLLVEPYDPVVFERTMMRDGLALAAPSQVVVDLLTSPGRAPAEADALVGWMEEHEDAWRS